MQLSSFQLRSLLWLASFGALSVSEPVWAQTPPLSVSVDGRPLAFGDAPPRVLGGRVLVPLRAIFEALGAQVTFSNGVISASRGQTSLQLTLGSNQALLGREIRTLDAAPQILEGKTFVPLRFVGEALGAGVKFDGSTGQISLTSSSSSSGAISSGFAVPSAQTVNGTVLRVDAGTPTQLILTVGGTLKSYELAPNSLVLRQLSVAQNLNSTPIKGAVRPTDLRSVVAGSDVRLTLDSNGKVTQLLLVATIVLARVQFAADNQIILDDDRDTTLTISDSLPFTDARGQNATTVSLPAGALVALFLSRETRTVYRVSAAPADLTIPNGGTADATSDPIAGIAPANSPQIMLVQTDVKTPQRAGARVGVRARATPGQRLFFSLGARVQNVPMSEDANEPGTYRGTYIVKTGDNALAVRPSVRLVSSDGFETTLQADTEVTLDTQAPKLEGTFPVNGARTGLSQPNIVIFAQDYGGSGLKAAKITLTTASGEIIDSPATVAPPSQVSTVAPANLSGLVRVNAQISDGAGNTLPVAFSFTVGAGTTGAIQSFAHGATRALLPGEEVPLELLATAGGEASFEVRGAGGQIIAQDLTMVEDGNTPGRYRASFRVPDGTWGALRFIGRFAPGDGTSSSAETSAPVQITNVSAPLKLSISSHKNGDLAVSPLVLRGKAAPNAQIEVTVTAMGTQFFVFEYREDLGTFAARADAQGNWQTEGIALPARKNVGGLAYEISATQTDVANRSSTPVTLNLRAR